MKLSTVLAVVVTFVCMSAPAWGQRRIDAAAKANKLLGSLAKARDSQASRLEEELASLATDITYMDAVEPVLIKGLKSRNVRQRRAAARVLRYTISGAAVGPLSRIVAKDRSADVRLEAATSLCILKADEAVGILRTAGTSDRNARVRAAAAAALDVIEDRDGGRRAGCRRALQRRLAKVR